MSTLEPFVTYLELRESTPEGEQSAGLSHTLSGLVLLHVLELAAAGEPRGAVTVVHEAGEHGGRYLDFARALASAGWAVALPDLRGHGRSEGARGHSNGLKEILRDLGDVQDHLAYRQPEAPKVLLGFGLGALWSLAYACEKPDDVAALVLVAPRLQPKFELPAKPSGLFKSFKKQASDAPGKLGFGVAQDPADPLRHDVITLRAGEQALEAAAKYGPRLAQLTLPVLNTAKETEVVGWLEQTLPR
ncbi:MAG: alpha/beta fold hydrolase [Planctomycetes bacterium]|nr:alpha/beta fold hydrolase [Planctomycetota bacterium]